MGRAGPGVNIICIIITDDLRRGVRDLNSRIIERLIPLSTVPIYHAEGENIYQQYTGTIVDEKYLP